MNNQYWKSKYFAKNINESHVYIFRSLEIKQYLQQILKSQGFVLHTYKLNFSNSIINVFISIYRTKQTYNIIKKNKPQDTLLLKNKIKSYCERKCKFIPLPTKLKYRKILKLYKNSLFTLNSSKLNRNFLKKILESLNLFTNNKFNITLTVKEINNINTEPNANQVLLKLKKFQKTPFFPEGNNFLIPFMTQDNSAKLLTNFIAIQLKTIKRHNFFFNFLKESLVLALNQKISKIQGVKLVIKGRLNNAARAKHKIFKIGKIPQTTINSNIDYAKSTAFTLNGTLGIKVWVCKKPKKNIIKCFYNQEKLNTKKLKKANFEN